MVPATPKAATIGTAKIMGVFKKRPRTFWKNVVGSSVAAATSISLEPSTPEKAFKLVDDDVVAAADVELNLVFIFFIELVRLEAVTNGCMLLLLLWRTMDCCPAKASTLKLQARTHSKATIKGESLDVMVIVVVVALG
jgi:hypothetical protein